MSFAGHDPDRNFFGNFDENFIEDSDDEGEFDSDFYDEDNPRTPKKSTEVLIPEEELFRLSPKPRRTTKRIPTSKPTVNLVPPVATRKLVPSVNLIASVAMAQRARRPDSKQMWDESERRAPARDERRDDRRDDRRDRDRRYRSRSPRESRGQGQERDYRQRDPGRDERGSRDERGGRRDGERGGDRGADRGSRRDEGRDRERNTGRDARDKPRDRSRSRERAKDHGKRDARSRSPRKDRDGEAKKEAAVKKQVSEPPQEEAPPVQPAAPVSFKVGGPVHTPDPDRMETDEDLNQVPKEKSSKSKKAKAKPIEEDDDIEVEDDGMAAMQAMMGFGGFGTTHQKKVEGNNVSAIRKEKKTEYRQYMNRQGGFNRPLSPTRDP